MFPAVMFLCTWLGTVLLVSSSFGQVGLMPVPTLQSVQMQAEASFDQNSSIYTYVYTVTNPGANTGRIFLLIRTR